MNRDLNDLKLWNFVDFNVNLRARSQRSDAIDCHGRVRETKMRSRLDSVADDGGSKPLRNSRAVRSWDERC